jgi:acetyl-CoA C-acetyltransferase
LSQAVIVATARSPIGRAEKGSLKDMRPDDLLVQMIQAALSKVPSLDANSIDDFLIGTGSPAGEGGYNIARVAAVMMGLDNVPGVTVNRYCSSSLQTTRMAMHAIRAGEGDVFISGGVETVSRYGNGLADFMAGTTNPIFADALAKSAQRAIDSSNWQDPRKRCPT